MGLRVAVDAGWLRQHYIVVRALGCTVRIVWTMNCTSALVRLDHLLRNSMIVRMLVLTVEWKKLTRANTQNLTP